MITSIKLPLLALVAYFLLSAAASSLNPRAIGGSVPYHHQRCASELVKPSATIAKYDYMKYYIDIGREFSTDKCNEFKSNLGYISMWESAPNAAVTGYYMRYAWNGGRAPTTKFSFVDCGVIENNYTGVSLWVGAGQQVALNKVLAKTFPVVNSVQPFKCLGVTGG